MASELAITEADYSVRNIPLGAVTQAQIPHAWIAPSAINPRTHFAEDSLAELAQSIRELGILQPITVRDLGADPGGPPPYYAIVAGERRWRAAALAGLEVVPVLHLGTIDDSTALRIALIENLQRADLDPIEEAEGFAALNRVVGLRQAQIAAAVHRSQPAIANRLRLLELPADVQQQIRQGALSPAHGVALARYKAHPAVLSALASEAIERRLPTAALEADPDWPTLSALERAGVVHDLSDARFPRTVCQECPFGAYRAWQRGGYCLRPTHFAELQEAATAEALAKAQAAEASGRTVLDLSKLGYGTYERCGSYGAPKACSEACPCRAIGRERGGLQTEICTDPKRWNRLKRAQTREDNREAALAKQAFLTTSCAHVDALLAPGARELALLIATSAGDYSFRAQFKKALSRHAPLLAIDADKIGWEERRAALAELLAPLSIEVLTRIGMEMLLRGEAENTQRSTWASWYLRLPTAPRFENRVPVWEPPTEISDDPDEADDEERLNAD